MAVVGVMQGRLGPPDPERFQSFPRERWQAEFAGAMEAGIDCIEWIYDSWGEEINPLATDDGVLLVQALSTIHGVAVRSLCADWFMEHPFVTGSSQERRDGIARLRWLLQRAALMSIRRVVVPFVDNSSLGSARSFPALLDALVPLTAELRALNLELHLETDLAPKPFAALMELLPLDTFRVNYDSGNSASLGYVASDEMMAYGSRIGSVHIKDRVRGGGTVPLGRGNANFADVFQGLRRVGYSGEYILQVAREEPGGEIALARRNRAFVDHCLSSANGSVL